MSTTPDSWFLIADTDKLDTPALVIYPDRVQHNIDLLKDMIDDASRLRPHVKTHKSSEVTLLLLKAGITKFKCATIAEAEMLGINHAPDVLLAYQPVGPAISRLMQLIKAYPQTSFSCLVDNEVSARCIANEAVESGIQVKVYLDLNVGMNRTGIIPSNEALELYQICSSLQGLQTVGLHAYDGHIHDRDILVRTHRANQAFEQVERLKNDIVAAGSNEPVLVLGGTPTFPVYAQKAKIECSPGTFVYWDAGYEQAFTEQPFKIAAIIITRVVSMPGSNLLCLDLGHKAISAENVLANRVVFPGKPEWRVVSQSEEHLVIDAGEGHNYQIGDLIYAAPYHVCPAVALYSQAITVIDRQVTGVWPITARSRKINI